MAEFEELHIRVERGEWITTTPVWVEILAQNSDGRRKSESGGGSWRSSSGEEKSGQQRQREEERNPDVDPRLRVVEIFQDFLCEANRDGITFPKGADYIEV